MITEKRIIKLYLDGESALTIQKKFKVNYAKVYKVLEKNNIKRRTHSEKTLNALLQGRGSNSKLQRKVASEQWKGKNNPRWKPLGSKRRCHDYILVKTENGWEKEERLIAEKKLKRKLTKNETIHHINGIKDDNRLENLYLMTRKEHKAWHALDNFHKNLSDNRLELVSNI